MNAIHKDLGRRVLALALLVALLCGALPAALAEDDNATKPTIKANQSAYVNGSVVLQWSKVSGASSYEVYRATSKSGSYKKFASTKKTKLTKKTSGEYFYKVRAVKGGKKTAFSSPVHIFAANGRITEKTFSSYKGIQFRVLVTNKSGRAMNFLAVNPSTVYLVNKSTGQVVGQASAMLDALGTMGITVGAKKKQALWLSCYDYSLWTTYSGATGRYTWLVVLPFYPGTGDDAAIPFALAAGLNAGDSAIAARN